MPGNSLVDGRPQKQTIKRETLETYDIEEKTEIAKVPVSVEDIAYSIFLTYGWTDKDWQALKTLWGNESGWDTNAVNPTSGACGIPQAWPCSKIGNNWRDPRTQLEWGANYIHQRYNTPTQALSFWHSQCGSSKGCWY